MPGTKVAEELRREQIIAAAHDVAVRGGLSAVTVRDVALQAELSTGLVLFHFGTKDQLILALLERVLAAALVPVIGLDVIAIDDPMERLVALLRHEMRRLARDRKRVRLLFEFWSAGQWDRAIGAAMQRELDRYRDALRPMVEDAIAADPDRFAGVTVGGLTAVVASFIKGCAVQSAVDPTLDISDFLRAMETLLVPQRLGARR